MEDGIPLKRHNVRFSEKWVPLACSLNAGIEEIPSERVGNHFQPRPCKLPLTPSHPYQHLYNPTFPTLEKLPSDPARLGVEHWAPLQWSGATVRSVTEIV